MYHLKQGFSKNRTIIFDNFVFDGICRKLFSCTRKICRYHGPIQNPCFVKCEAKPLETRSLHIDVTHFHIRIRIGSCACYCNVVFNAEFFSFIDNIVIFTSSAYKPPVKINTGSFIRLAVSTAKIWFLGGVNLPTVTILIPLNDISMNSSAILRIISTLIIS